MASLQDLSTEQVGRAAATCSTGTIPKIRSNAKQITTLRRKFKKQLRTVPNSPLKSNDYIVGTSEAFQPFCEFCFTNKYPTNFYENHALKDEHGFISCPILRKYVCPVCQTAGTFAHTIEECLYIHAKEPYVESFLRTSTLKSKNNSSLGKPSDAAINYSTCALQPLYPNFPNTEMQLGYWTSAKTEYNLLPQTAAATPHFLSTAFEQQRQPLPLVQCKICAQSGFASIKDKNKEKKKCCTFCRRNKKPNYIYSSHNLRDENGVLECNYLRDYVCGICGATGDDAHTKKYCPQNTNKKFFENV